jgi:hypothetical protein
MDKLQVAKTILFQMGGANRLSAMIGARYFAGGENNLTFQFRGSKIANLIRITLKPSDTYTMEFFKTRGSDCKKVSEDEMIYCDMLRDVFEMATGLAI